MVGLTDSRRDTKFIAEFWRKVGFQVVNDVEVVEEEEVEEIADLDEY
jgi:hypothetical protein